MKLEGNYSKKARIELIPLIDSIFLVLVFFMYAMMSMVVHRGIEVDVPEVVSSIIDEEKYISLTVTKNNEIFIDKEPTALESLVDQLSSMRSGKDKNELQVYINADKEAYHGLVIEVLDRVRTAGITKVSFEVDPEDEK